MAKSWSVAEAVQVVVEGTDKAAIQDIGRRFPLFAVAAASGTTGLLEIISHLSDKVTVRTLEAKMKEGVTEMEDEEEVVEKTPAKKAPAKAKAPAKKAPAKEEEDVFEEDDEDMSDDGYDDMTPAELKAEAKKLKINITGLKSKAAVIEALRGSNDDTDDWGDEEEEEEPTPKKQPAKGRAAGSKTAAAKGKGTTAKSKAKPKQEPEDLDGDDEDWDFE